MNTNIPTQPRPPAAQGENLEHALERAYPGVSPKDIFNPFRYPLFDRLIVLAALLAVFAWQAAPSRLPRDNGVSADRAPAASPLPLSGETFPPESRVLETLGARELFLFPKKPAPPPRAPEPRGPGLREKLASLSLLGVLEETPLQAIVESRKTRETYMLRAGDRLFSMEVLSVDRDRVTFREGDETEVLQ
jgi:hypothetical protein